MMQGQLPTPTLFTKTTTFRQAMDSILKQQLSFPYFELENSSNSTNQMTKEF